MMSFLRYGVAATLLLLIVLLHAALAADSPIVLAAAPCFSGMSPGNVYPVLVTLKNKGESVQGVLHASDALDSPPTRLYSYPLDLPEGTVKTVVAYPMLSSTSSSVSLEFSCAAGTWKTTVDVRSNAYQNWNQANVGVIGDGISSIGAIRTFSPGGYASFAPNVQMRKPAYQTLGSTFVDSYARPENAPSAAAGYRGLDLLVIADGAERLDDDQWHAIRQWVLSGGSLLLFGGAGSLAYLKSPDCAALAPMFDLHETTMPVLVSPFMADHGAVYKNVDVVTGSLKPGADSVGEAGNAAVISRLHCGVGVVTLVGFNPTADPFRQSPNSAAALIEMMRDAEGGSPSGAPEMWATRQLDGDSGQTYYGGYSPMVVPQPMVPRTDPFHVSLPPLGTVAFILMIYFVLAIPVTYVTLRKRGCLELAWITTPVLGVLFACIFAVYAANLYRSALSQRTAGVIFANVGEADARFEGVTDMFFPLGGDYNIVMPGAEWLETSSLEGGFGPSVASDQGVLETTSSPSGVIAHPYVPSNLAFKCFAHAEEINLGGPVSANLVETEDGTGLSGSITNRTAYGLSHVTVNDVKMSRWFDIGDLGVGATKTILLAPNEVPGRSMTNTGMFGPSPFAEANMAYDAPIRILADCPGTNIGSNIGKKLEASGNVLLLLSCSVSKTSSGSSR
jgi:hypothetical protein